MSALGETFRAARESQGLTLTQVADRIHIRSLYLAAIEAEDWPTIGPPVYVRGFLRTYARALGLDGDAAVADFTAIGPESTPVLATPRGEPSRSGQPRGDAVRRSGLSYGAIAGLLVALLLVMFVGYQYYDYQHGRAAVTVDGTSAGSTDAPAQPAASVDGLQRPAQNAPSDRVDSASSGFALRLRDISWLRVVVDGKVMMEGVFPKGTVRTFAGRSATIRTGNAGGVELSLNGKQLGPMGGLGDVAERSFQL